MINLKLNTDCIRDVLLYLEKNLKIENRNFVSITLSALQENLSKYSAEDVFYTIYNLSEARFVDCKWGVITSENYRHCDISNITYRGHQFLESVRPETIWEKTKTVASKVGVHTLEFIESVAREIAVELAKQAFVTTPNTLI